jgi:hypothetical protein
MADMFHYSSKLKAVARRRDGGKVRNATEGMEKAREEVRNKSFPTEFQSVFSTVINTNSSPSF